MPDLLLRDTSPYGTRRASVLRGDGDVYLYLEDLTGPAPQTASAVWVANHSPAPVDSAIESVDAVRGGPARMVAAGTVYPDGCPPFDELHVVWFEEGDAVALIDGQGLLAMIPGWAGTNGFYGYSRYARGETPLAFELTADSMGLLQRKVSESQDFWSWRNGPGWSEVRASGVDHLEAAIGPKEAAWPLGKEPFPELIASRHRYGDHDIWVTATTGLSAQSMAGVEQFHDEPDTAARVELAIARSTPDQIGAELLGALAQIPFGRCTWLGEGHTIGGIEGSYPAFGPEKAALLLTAHPPAAPAVDPPNLRGLVRRGVAVTYLWVLVIDEESFHIARGRNARSAVAHLGEAGVTWIQ